MACVRMLCSVRDEVGCASPTGAPHGAAGWLALLCSKSGERRVFFPTAVFFSDLPSIVRLTRRPHQKLYI